MPSWGHKRSSALHTHKRVSLRSRRLYHHWWGWGTERKAVFQGGKKEKVHIYTTIEIVKMGGPFSPECNPVVYAVKQMPFFIIP